MIMDPYSSTRPHFSPGVLIIATTLNILLSLGLLVLGFWLAFRHHIICLKLLEIPILFIGAALFVSSLCALWAVVRRRMLRLWPYLVLLFFLLLLLLAFTLFAFFVTNGGGGHLVPAASFQEYELSDYSAWLQNEVRDPYKWLSLRACLRDGRICSGLNRRYSTLISFEDADLSPVQSGCCKPPSACGYTFVRPTQWVNPTNEGADSDCGDWDNTNLCYNCDACKAGLLENVRQSWRTTAEVCLAILIVLVVVYLITWAAFLKGIISDQFTPHGGFSQTPIS